MFTSIDGINGISDAVFLSPRFGLLHRIPPQPEDRLPGSTPVELQEAAEEYEEQELFVPADVHSEARFGLEQLEEWRLEHTDGNQEDPTFREFYNHLEQDPRTIHAPTRQGVESYTNSVQYGQESQGTHPHAASRGNNSRTSTIASPLLNDQSRTA